MLASQMPVIGLILDATPMLVGDGSLEAGQRGEWEGEGRGEALMAVASFWAMAPWKRVGVGVGLGMEMGPGGGGSRRQAARRPRGGAGG